jgi:hypothetical protein
MFLVLGTDSKGAPQTDNRDRTVSAKSQLAESNEHHGVVGVREVLADLLGSRSITA